jgi:hypothetical protein
MSQVRQLVFAAALCVVAIAAYTAFHGSSGAGAESPPQSNLPKYLRFNGTGTVSVTPDQATIHFSTTGRAGTLSEATNEASAGMSRVLVAMREMGVKKHDTQTDGVSGYKDDQTGLYQAEQDLTVTVTHIDRTGKLLAAGIRAGAQATYGPEFSTADQHAGQASAVRAAVQNARAQADAAAAAAGMQVTGVISISETQPFQPFYGDATAFAAKATSPVAAVPVRVGKQRQTATVSVVFSYGPA